MSTADAKLSDNRLQDVNMSVRRRAIAYKHAFTIPAYSHKGCGGGQLAEFN